MKTFLKWLALILFVLVIAFISGPKPPKPDFNAAQISLPSSLPELENQVNLNEKSVKGIKPDNEARIVWADTARKEKTNIAFLYLHGFSASQAEGAPVHTDLAKHFNSNLYLARLAEHGIDRGDSTMIDLTATKYFRSAERALAIAKQLGEEVVVIGTSTGGALSLFLASRHPEIKALVLYSPCVKLYDGSAVILDKPWGRQIAYKITGSNISKYEPESPEHANYWSLQYRLEALVALQDLLSNTMKKETFKKITCPVFMAYYYKNEEEQDNTVSVPAMLKMFDELTTPASGKEKMAFPEAGAHVIASYIRSKDWQGVERETERFLSGIIK
jgi:esterase/lipase